jgi:hypothetical protein
MQMSESKSGIPTPEAVREQNSKTLASLLGADQRLQALCAKAFQGKFGQALDKVKSAFQPMNVLKQLTGTGFMVGLEQASESHSSAEMMGQIAKHASVQKNLLAEEMALALQGKAAQKSELQLFSASVSGMFMLAGGLIPSVPSIPEFPLPTLPRETLQTVAARYGIAESLDKTDTVAKLLIKKGANETALKYALDPVNKGKEPKEGINQKYLASQLETLKFARILLMYLAPARNSTAPADLEDRRMALRHSLGATHDNRSYQMSTEERDDSFGAEHRRLNSSDFMELFFTAGFKELNP